jgi:hypothetical protein
MTCTACGCPEMELFHDLRDIPVHNTLLMKTREEAIGFPRGDLRLGFCPWCGFIRNVDYDPSLQAYSDQIEETQAFSATFNTFHRKLAEDLIERHCLRGKTILEIGCGKGEFLNMLCDLGGNEGIGFDPAVSPERNGRGKARFIADFYSAKYARMPADFVVCKMTLEHIRDAASFVRMARCQNAPTFFMIPDGSRVLQDIAFWDVYYEHCSYFTPGALGRLFRSQGWEVTDLRNEYGGQYLALEARPAGETPNAAHPLEETVEEARRQVEHFRLHAAATIAMWRTRIRDFARNGLKWVIWGGGSKAVAFVSALGGAPGGLACAVDINPYKQGCFLPGSGVPVVSPEALGALRPDHVVLMNPIYRREVEAELIRVGIDASVIAVDHVPVERELVKHV